MIDYLASFINTNGASFPLTLGVNATGPSTIDGTEFVKLMIDDLWGFNQTLLDYANLTPDGVTEAPSTSQRMEAIKKGFAVGPGIGVNYWKDGDPSVNGDRVLLLQGQGVLRANYPELDVAVYVGDGNNPTAPSFYHADDSAGTSRNISGAYIILPDARGINLRGSGTHGVLLRANSNAVVGPTFGGTENDQIQGHEHLLRSESGSSLGTSSTAGTGVDFSVAYGTGDSNDQKAYGADPDTDGTNGTPRIGDETRGFGLGCAYGITY